MALKFQKLEVLDMNKEDKDRCHLGITSRRFLSSTTASAIGTARGNHHAALLVSTTRRIPTEGIRK